MDLRVSGGRRFERERETELVEGERQPCGDNTDSKGSDGGGSTSVPSPLKEKEKVRVSRTSSIL